MVISAKGSRFDVLSDEEDAVFTVVNRLNGRICRILVNPVEEFYLGFQGNSLVNFGYLLAVTMYSVHWFSVKVSKASESTTKPVVSYLGFKLFKTGSVVGACWSPHLPEESVVLLQSGDLFMFDVNDRESKGKRLRVSWTDDDLSSSRNCKWLGVEFSWHPRILIVARLDAVFLVDFRCDNRNVSLLAKIDTLNLYTPVEKELFCAFCKVGSDGFHFALASDSLLVLCDVRRPLMPVLQWAHGLDKPSYIDSFRLSELRSNSRDNTYEWANESGFGIILGSFSNCEFSLFCYGPSLPGQGGPFASEISRIFKSLYAWELPSGLLLSGCDCQCGSCLVREEFSKDALPLWIDWQQKKDIVLGFGILDSNLSAVFHEADEFGGFTLIRLMSSGKLEVQRFCASWDPIKKFEPAHGASLLHFENNLPCCTGGRDYRFRRTFKYLKFDYLSAHLGGNLTELMDSKMRNSFDGLQQEGSFSIEFHEILCEKLNICGFSQFRTSPDISLVFGDISLPLSVREVALKRIWACLPIELLQLAFSSYTEILEVFSGQKASLEFSVVPDLPQLPPFFLRKHFCRSNKWSQKFQRDDAIVGPVLPLPILVTLYELQNGSPDSQEVGKFSSEEELNIRCDEVMQVAIEMAVSDSAAMSHNDCAVSLADDRDDLWVDSQKSKPFISYNPTAFECSMRDYNHVFKDVRFSKLISKVPERPSFPKDKADSIAPDLYDDLCPIALKYDDCIANITPPELKIFNVLKRQFSRWQDGFSPYCDFCTQLNLKKQRK